MLDVACDISAMPPIEARRHRRYTTLRGASVRSVASAAFPGSIVDLSSGGCRLATRATLALGTRVCIRIDGMHSLWGHVVWQHGTDVGVAFEQPMHPAVVEHIATVTPR
ncbi:MAG: PilZ domain-containing protein [Sphingomonas sp.]